MNTILKKRTSNYKGGRSILLDKCDELLREQLRSRTKVHPIQCPYKLPEMHDALLHNWTYVLL